VNVPVNLEWFGAIPEIVFPSLLLGIFVISFLLYQWYAEWWLLKTLLSILMAPFRVVKFKDFYIADQLVSLAIILYDIEYCLCYFIYDVHQNVENQVCLTSHTWVKPLLSALPAFWRLMQSLRRYRDSRDMAQIYNAGKYFVVFFVVIFSFLKVQVVDTWAVLWILSCIVATIYSTFWDIKKDWSLGNFRDKNHKGLRKVLLYPIPWYYVALVSNAVMRLMWTLTISPNVLDAIGGSVNASDILTTCLAVVEIFRRAQWNIFRLENEQINNIGKFRVTKDVPLPIPLDELDKGKKIYYKTFIY